MAFEWLRGSGERTTVTAPARRGDVGETRQETDPVPEHRSHAPGTTLLRGEKPNRRPFAPGVQIEGGAGDVVAGRATPRPEAPVNHGVLDATLVTATPLPEQLIPISLSAPVRALAEAALSGSSEWKRWSDIPRQIQDVIRAYDTAHDQVCAAAGMHTPEIQQLRENSALEFQNIMREIHVLRARGTNITDRLVELMTRLQEREARVAADVAALVFLNALLQDGTIRYFLSHMNSMSSSLQVDYLLQQDTQYAQSGFQQTARALKQHIILTPSQTLTRLLDILPNRSAYTQLLQRLGLG